MQRYRLLSIPFQKHSSDQIFTSSSYLLQTFQPLLAPDYISVWFILKITLADLCKKVMMQQEIFNVLLIHLSSVTIMIIKIV